MCMPKYSKACLGGQFASPMGELAPLAHVMREPHCISEICQVCTVDPVSFLAILRTILQIVLLFFRRTTAVLLGMPFSSP